jgi:hypothetical protein
MGSVYHLRQIVRLDSVLLPRLLIYLEVSVFDIAEFVATPRRCTWMTFQNLSRLGSPRIQGLLGDPLVLKA